MTRTRTIRALAAPIISAGILASALFAATPAIAEPMSGSDCPSMAMPGTQASAGNPSVMTRAGQIGAANAPQASADAPMDCTAASHG